MKLILVGSGALKIRAPYLIKREPRDFDFICTEDAMKEFLSENPSHEKVEIPKGKLTPVWRKEVFLVDGMHVEFEIAEPSSSAEEFIKLVSEDGGTIETSFGAIPSLDLLFTLKDTHKYLKDSPHFWKNAQDWHRMRLAGASVPEFAKPWHKRRKKETYHYRHPRLKAMRGEDFFDPDQGVNYKFDHDSIHRAIAILDKPAYRYYMKDGEEVDCDKEKFFSLPEEYRLNGVIEEACVLAIERSLVPFPGGMTPEKAWHFALAKVCTSITSGWFRKFAYDNLPKIMKMYPTGYWEKFQAGIENGTVLPFTGKKY